MIILTRILRQTVRNFQRYARRKRSYHNDLNVRALTRRPKRNLFSSSYSPSWSKAFHSKARRFYLALGVALGTTVAIYQTVQITKAAGERRGKQTFGYGSRQRHEIPQKAIDECRATFNSFATIEENGEKFMSYEDFLKAVAGKEIDPHAEEKTFRTLFKVADVGKDGRLDWEEFLQFELVMTGPEADYRIAFEYFDNDGNGAINFDEFKKVCETSEIGISSAEFNFNCDWVRSFFGNNFDKSLNYEEFTQLLKGLEGEVIRQTYHVTAEHHKNTITKEEFENIVLRKFSVRFLAELPSFVKENLQLLAGDSVTYSQFIAFYNVIRNFDRVREAIVQTTEQKQHSQITKKEFLRVARRMTLLEFTPMEVDVVFRIFDRDNDGLVSLEDFTSVMKPAITIPELNPSITQLVLESLFHFALGSVAGAIGAFAVYPIDLVKTRMQNQRHTAGVQRLYNNSWDCFVKVLKGEGFRGLYKGLIPQLIGVAPEKAIKLTVNDLLRSVFGQPGGHIFFPLEVLAGGSAGASQVIFTNPIEIIKIRLQTQGESAKFGVKPKSTPTIIRELGFSGLYKGAAACLLRDIPFSAIYFPGYAWFKQWLTDPSVGSPTPGALLLAGTLAAIPAASLVTPADVIKTRLQVEARTGQQTYKNIPDAARKIWQAEGFRAFWKGAPARVFRSAPQFGVTLFSYELLQRALAPGLKDPRPPTNAPVSQVDYYNVVARGGVGRSLRRVDQRWGLFGHHKILSEQEAKVLINKQRQ